MRRNRNGIDTRKKKEISKARENNNTERTKMRRGRDKNRRGTDEGDRGDQDKIPTKERKTRMR